MKGGDMKTRLHEAGDEPRAGYDFDYSQAVRGKYYRRITGEQTNVVVLDPDVAMAFRDSAVVNEALRALLHLSVKTRRLTQGVRAHSSTGADTKPHARRRRAASREAPLLAGEEQAVYGKRKTRPKD